MSVSNQMVLTWGCTLQWKQTLTHFQTPALLEASPASWLGHHHSFPSATASKDETWIPYQKGTRLHAAWSAHNIIGLCMCHKQTSCYSCKQQVWTAEHCYVPAFQCSPVLLASPPDPWTWSEPIVEIIQFRAKRCIFTVHFNSDWSMTITYQHWFSTCLQVGLHDNSKSGCILRVVQLTLQVPEFV